jgi:hypothetical protein
VVAFLEDISDHLKDIYFDNWSKLGDTNTLPMQKGAASRGNFEFRPTGYGVVQNAVYAPYYLACKPSWLAIDHDYAYERDPYADLAASLEYTRNLVEYTRNNK